jgi:D-glycero-D-manno-heptose 1,7-bisphosphate phosphatase
MQPAVFLDRDGTLIEDVDFLDSVEEIKMIPNAIEALSLLSSAGYLLVLVTNQSGVGRGLFDLETVKVINNTVGEQLDGLINAFYVCPHLPDGGCECRKPKAGMISQAVLELNIDLANSWIVGDKKSDIETGFNAGLATALVLTGYGEAELRRLDRLPDVVSDNIMSAAREIVSRTDQ